MAMLPSVLVPLPARPSTPKASTAPVRRFPTISEPVATEAIAATGISTFCHAVPMVTTSSKVRFPAERRGPSDSPPR
jgi:hypothetical protein